MIRLQNKVAIITGGGNAYATGKELPSRPKKD